MHCINFWFFLVEASFNSLVVVDVGSVAFGVGAVLFPAIDYFPVCFSFFSFVGTLGGLFFCSLFPYLSFFSPLFFL